MNNGFKNISKQGMSLHLYNKKNGMNKNKMNKLTQEWQISD